MKVRPHGRELRVGGTSASWYQPGRLLTGSVWDALAVPLVALPARSRRQLLILGLGGGSAAHLLRAAAPEARIVGVELEEKVVTLARRHFELDRLSLEIQIEDASAFLERDAGGWDFILEDCFIGVDGDLGKPAWFLEHGVEACADRLAPGGVFVVDTIHESGLLCAQMRDRFAHVVGIRLEDCTNHVLVGTDRELDASSLRAAVKAHPLLSDALGNLRFRTLT
ncbi:MAG: spermidine synthase [Sandaracinaceae bacterium]